MARLYRWLLHGLLPREFLREYGAELEHSMAARLRRAPNRALRLFLFGKELADLLRTAGREWADELVPPGAEPEARARLTGIAVQDFADALRRARRAPRFTALTVVMIGTGVGCSTAVYSIVEQVLLAPLPFERPEELVMIWPQTTGEEPSRGHLSLPNVESLGDAPIFEVVEGVNTSSAAITGLEETEVVLAARATGGIMAILGAEPLMGRDLTASDAARGATRVVVVSHRFWESRLRGRADVIGHDLHLFEEPYRIVGVAPPGFDYPEQSMLWLPFGASPDGCGRDCAIVERAVGRLSSGTTIEQARSGTEALALSLAAEYPGEFPAERGFWVESMLDYEVGAVRAGLLLTLAAVMLVLFIVCINTAVLLATRASQRRREITIRLALGASTSRLWSHLAAETGVLVVGGALCGWVLATGIIKWVRVGASDFLPRISEVSVDGSVVVMLIAVAALAAFGVGLYPARRLGTRAAFGRVAPMAHRGRWSGDSKSRSVLIACEVALCMVSLAAAGLLIASVRELDRVEMGFDGASVTRFTLVPPIGRYPERPDLVDLFRAVEREIETLPAVREVGSVFGAPLTTDRLGVRVSAEGVEVGEGEVLVYRPATAGYFETMGIPIVAGRGLQADATLETAPEAVINQRAALALFGQDGQPIDQVVRISSVFGESSTRVVGIVGDVRRNITAEPEPAIYPLFPTIDAAWRGLVVHARATGGGDLTGELRGAVARVDPRLVAALPERVSDARRRETLRARVFGTLLMGFSLVAVLLAGTGLYGAVGFLVSQRTAEIGVRMALGAGRRRVVRLVAGQGFMASAGGLVVGVLLVRVLGDTIESMLFGVVPSDPRIVGLAAFVILAVAFVACWMPVRQATRIDPTAAMRAE